MPVKLKLSISDIDWDHPGGNRPLPTSPTSVLALKKAGLAPEELYKLPLSYFKARIKNSKAALKRYRAHERMRQQDLQDLEVAYQYVRSHRTAQDFMSDTAFQEFLLEKKRQKERELQNQETKEVATMVREEFERRELAKELEEKRRLHEEKQRLQHEEYNEEKKRKRRELAEMNRRRNEKVQRKYDETMKLKRAEAEMKQKKSLDNIELIKKKKIEKLQKKTKEAKKKALKSKELIKKNQQRRDKEHQEFLKDHQKKRQIRRQMIEQQKRALREENMRKAQDRKAKLARVQQQRQRNLEEQRRLALEKHEKQERRLAELIENRQKKEKEKQRMMQERSLKRMQQIAEKEKQTVFLHEQKMKKQEEKKKKISHIMKMKDAKLRDRSIELAIKHEKRRKIRQRHLIQGEYKREEQIKYMDEKLKRIERKQKEERDKARLNRHATIMQQQSRRKMQEFLRSIKNGSKITIPKWMSKEKFDAFMREHGQVQANIATNAKKKNISQAQYEHLLGTDSDPFRRTSFENPKYVNRTPRTLHDQQYFQSGRNFNIVKLT